MIMPRMDRALNSRQMAELGRRFTRRGMGFFSEAFQIESLGKFIESTAGSYDELFAGSAKVLLDLYAKSPDPASPATRQLLRSATEVGRGDIKQRQFQDFQRILYEMLYTRVVDAFLSYISDLR